MNPAKTSVFAVCLAQSTGQRGDFLQAAIHSFLRQDYPGQLRLLVVADSDTLTHKLPSTPNPKISFLTIPKNKFCLGELRNAAKTFVTNVCLREKRVSYLLHWDDDDYCHPDRVAVQVAGTDPGNISTLRQTLRFNCVTGYSMVGGHNTYGDVATLLYPANIPACFPKVAKNTGEKFTESARAIGTAFQLVSADPAICVRTYHGNNNTEHHKFIMTSRVSREINESERLYLEHLQAGAYGFLNRDK